MERHHRNLKSGWSSSIPKHTGLWAFTEPIKQAALSINEKKNFKLTLGKLVSDVKGLADLKN